MTTNLKQFTIVYVDDEPNALKYFTKNFQDDFTILTVNNAAEADRLLAEKHNEIAIVISDQRMPGETGVQLFGRIKNLYPRILRILVTAFADFEIAIEAVNKGSIYQYISKPWEIHTLRIVIQRALEYYQLVMQRDQLLDEKLTTIQKIAFCDYEKNLTYFAYGLNNYLPASLAAMDRFFSACSTPGKISNDHALMFMDYQKWAKSQSRFIAQTNEMLGRILALAECDRDKVIAWESLPDNLSAAGQKLFGEYPAVEYENKLAAISSLSLPHPTLYPLALIIQALHELGEKKHPLVMKVDKVVEHHQADCLALDLVLKSPSWLAEQRNLLFSPLNDSKVAPEAPPICMYILTSYFIITQWGGDIEIPNSPDNCSINVRLPFAIKNNHHRPDPNQAEILTKIFSHHNKWS